METSEIKKPKNSDGQSSVTIRWLGVLFRSLCLWLCFDFQAFDTGMS